MRGSRRFGGLFVPFGVLVSLAQQASAQTAAPAAPVSSPAPTVAGDEPSTKLVRVPDELLRATPSGITGDTVGRRAAATSYAAKTSDEALRSAAARVDQQWATFLPRLSLKASYTRLSEITAPNLGTLVAANVTPGPSGATPITNLNQLEAIEFKFPYVFNNYLLQATLAVPISDYFLKMNKQYTAATQAVDAAKFDAVAARAKSAADGRIAFYNWLRARGAEVVAAQSLNDQRTHLNDAKNQFAVGNASRADVLRAETAVSSAELSVERAHDFTILNEKQVRVAIHAKDDEVLSPGEDLEANVPPLTGAITELTHEALVGRFEVKSIEANVESTKKLADAQRGSQYPSLSAFGDATYANPNSRIFPQTQTWFPTWDVGAQITWSPNDALIFNKGAVDIDARVAGLEAQKGTIRDGIEIEVMQAYQAAHEADFAMESTRRELASATEAYRVARELFNNGRATSTTLTDAETELTRARLDSLNAQTDLRISRVRLEHALGRDTKLAQ